MNFANILIIPSFTKRLRWLLDRDGWGPYDKNIDIDRNKLFPFGIYLSKVNNGKTKKNCGICSKVKITTQEWPAPTWCFQCWLSTRKYRLGYLTKMQEETTFLSSFRRIVSTYVSLNIASLVYHRLIIHPGSGIVIENPFDHIWNKL